MCTAALLCDIYDGDMDGDILSFMYGFTVLAVISKNSNQIRCFVLLVLHTRFLYGLRDLSAPPTGLINKLHTQFSVLEIWANIR